METVSFLKAMSASFDEMRAANELVDMVLVFGEVRLACHKVVLASSSDYFRRMFSCGLRESQSDEVVMKEMDAETGRLLVQYLYTGKIDITEENAQNLLSASNMLLLTDLEIASEKFLCEHIQPSNCVSLLNLSHLYELKDLIKRSQHFVAEQWTKVSDESIIDLKEEDFIEILEAHDSHEGKFIRLQRWVKANEEREQRFMDLMQLVDLPGCSKNFIRDIARDEELLNNTRGMQLIQKALKRVKITLHHEAIRIPSSPFRSESRSSPVRCHNLRWQLVVIRTSGWEDKLDVTIVCQSTETTRWSCRVNYEVRVWSHSPRRALLTKRGRYVFGPNQISLRLPQSVYGRTQEYGHGNEPFIVYRRTQMHGPIIVEVNIEEAG
ncbi:hypothetical protein CAPTEDRAFT_211783 [Capitella teleta]|uniref:BTB domain-containing protein n=1 Tax=Capitella teleta TaxID=283909 RepID=R7T8P1_CAPTE|nr:hypothetical protein CAPTEDRAFT_211783 [Capitella teleta]|eukprot:ELT87760.1 hypothetical protein CAPTEDRAFT_211783 [Capitella teleta]